MDPEKKPGRLVRETERTVERVYEVDQDEQTEAELAGADDAEVEMGDAEDGGELSGDESPRRRRGPSTGSRRGGR